MVQAPTENSFSLRPAVQWPRRLVGFRSCAQALFHKKTSRWSSKRGLFDRIVAFFTCLIAAVITRGIKIDDSIEDFAGRVCQIRPKSEDVSGQNGPVDTTPAGVHTRFVRQFRSFHRKRPKRGHVDSVFPTNNSSRCPHFRGVRPGSFRSRPVGHLTPRTALGGALSLSIVCLGTPSRQVGLRVLGVARRCEIARAPTDGVPTWPRPP